MFSKLISVVTLCMGASALLFQPGVNSGMAVSVIEQGKNAYFNAVMEKINGITIPDIVSSDGKSWLKGNVFTYLSTADNVVFSTDVTNNAMVLTCNKVSAMFYSADFRYHYAPLLNADGTLQLNLNTIKFVIGAGFGLQTLADGRSVPNVYGADTAVNINRFDLKISVTGGFDAALIDIVTPFIKGTLCDLIQAQLYTVLNQTIPNKIDSLLVKSDGFLHMNKLFGNTFWIDWETPASAIVSAESFTIEIKGDMFDTVYGEIDPLVTIPSMPSYDATKPEGYQNYISTWTMDTFGAALTEETPLGGWVNKAYGPMITTGSLNPFLVGIQGYYGDVPVAIHFSITKLGTFGVDPVDSMLNCLATMTLEFYAMTATGPELATSMTLIDTAVGFSILVNAMTMQLQLDTTNVDKLTVNYCSFGKLSALLMKSELNNFFRVFTPMINSDLANDLITVPSNLGLFQMTNLTLGYYQDYLYVGMTPVFVAPATAVEEQLRVAMFTQ